MRDDACTTDFHWIILRFGGWCEGWEEVLCVFGKKYIHSISDVVCWDVSVVACVVNSANKDPAKIMRVFPRRSK
jgi:hypothetical protein